MNSIVSLLDFTGRNKLPVIHQNEVAECGLACIAMIANFHGHKVDLNYLRRIYSLSSKGASLESLISLSEHLQLKTRPLQLEFNELSQLQTPCVLHWELNHFVVLKRVGKKYLHIHDPAMGYRRIPLRKASKSFTGVALEASPRTDFSPVENKEKPKLSMFWSKISGLKSALTQILLLSLLLQLGGIAAPYYNQLIIDDILLSEDRDFLNILALGFGMLAIFMALLSFLRSRVILYLSNQLNIQMGANLFSHLLRLPMDFFGKRHIGDVLSRFASLDKIKQLVSTSIVEALVDGFMSIGLLVMMFLYSPTLATITLITILIFVSAKIVLFSRLRQLNEEMIVNEAKQDSNFIESVRAIQTIKLFGNEKEREALWFDRFAETTNSAIKTSKFNINFNLLYTLLFGLETILVLYLAAHEIMDKLFTVGMLFAYLAYKAQLIIKASNLVDKAIEFKMIGLHLERLGDIALTQGEEVKPTDFNTESITGGIQANNLSYKYSEIEPYVFRGLNLTVKPGESVAITGPSGCGKTTLLKTLLGLLNPSEGSLQIDGHSMDKIGLREYRSIIGSVMQDDQLFSGTIYDNICFFNTTSDKDWVFECAKMASIHNDIIDMPMGYNTLVGDMGSSLSGGQKQRILLARALYQKPRILFLDEATSHLDPKVESKVNNAIAELAITRVIIAHRQETIESADRVIELKPLLENSLQ